MTEVWNGQKNASDNGERKGYRYLSLTAAPMKLRSRQRRGNRREYGLVDELDRIIDAAMREPLNEYDGQTFKTAVHAMAERVAQRIVGCSADRDIGAHRERRRCLPCVARHLSGAIGIHRGMSGLRFDSWLPFATHHVIHGPCLWSIPPSLCGLVASRKVSGEA